MVRLVFRPYTQVWRSICTSEPLRASIRVSPDFTLLGHSSPSFGSQRICSDSNLFPGIRIGRWCTSRDDPTSFSFLARLNFFKGFKHSHIRCTPWSVFQDGVIWSILFMSWIIESSFEVTVMISASSVSEWFGMEWTYKHFRGNHLVHPPFTIRKLTWTGEWVRLIRAFFTKTTSNQRPHTTSKRLPFKQFQVLLTPSSGSFSSFPHGTCSLSVSRPYLAWDGTYHPLRAAIPNNSTLWSTMRTVAG